MLRSDDPVKDRHLLCQIRAVQNTNRVVHRIARSTISQPADDLLPSSITITTDYSAEQWPGPGKPFCDAMMRLPSLLRWFDIGP
jgi:hypothetical protein